MKKVLTSKCDILLASIIPIMMGCNFVIVEIGGLHLYLSLILLSIFIIYSFTTINKCRNKGRSILDILLLASWVYFVLLSSLHDFNNAIVNIILYSLFITLILLYRRNLANYSLLLKSVLWGAAIAVLRVFFWGETNYKDVDVHSRFVMDFMGSINNSAYIISLSIIIAYYLIKNLILKIVIIGFFVFFNIYTLSRGANLVLLVLFSYVILTKQKKVIPLLLSILALFVYQFSGLIDDTLIDRYSISEDSETGGDNRTKVWLYALSKINSVETFLFGNGTGTFEFAVDYTISLTSTHNQYIDFIYSFGVFGSLPFLLMYTYYLKIVWSARKKTEFVFLINMLYAISFIFDSRLWIIQTIWLFPLVISYSLNTIKPRNSVEFYGENTIIKKNVKKKRIIKKNSLLLLPH